MRISHSMLRALIVAAVTVVGMASARSQTVGNFVPTADVVQHLHVDSFYEGDGGSRLCHGRYETYKIANLGLFDRFEVGANMDRSRNVVWGAKAKLLDDTKYGKFAVGFMNYVKSYHEPFAVYQYGYKGWTAGIGGIQRGDAHQGMGYLAIPLPHGVTFIADHFSGRAGQTGLGVWVPVYKTALTAGFAVGLPNHWTSDNKPIHYFSVEYNVGLPSLIH